MLQMWPGVPSASPAPRCEDGPAASPGCGPAVRALAEQQLLNLAALGILRGLGVPGSLRAVQMGRQSLRAPGLIICLDC